MVIMGWTLSVPHRASRWPRARGGDEIPLGRYICSKSPLPHAQYQIVPRLVRMSVNSYFLVPIVVPSWYEFPLMSVHTFRECNFYSVLFRESCFASNLPKVENIWQTTSSDFDMVRGNVFCKIFWKSSIKKKS